MRLVLDVPEDDDKSVEDVEADANVSTKSVGNDLQQHLNGKQSTEEYVAVLQDLSQRRRLQSTTHVHRYVRHYVVYKTRSRAHGASKTSDTCCI